MATKKISDEAKDKLGPAAAKQAEKQPPGDTELSGAAPGIKAETDPDTGLDTVATYDKPKATVKAEESAQKRADEVRDIQLEVHRKNVTNVPFEPVGTAYSRPDADKDPDSTTFTLAGSSVIVTATAREQTFTREEWLGYVRKVNQVAATL